MKISKKELLLILAAATTIIVICLFWQQGKCDSQIKVAGLDAGNQKVDCEATK